MSAVDMGISQAYSYGGNVPAQNGAGIMDVAKSAYKFAAKNKVLTKAANVGKTLGIPGSEIVGKVAKLTGTGKKRKSKK